MINKNVKRLPLYERDMFMRREYYHPFWTYHSDYGQNRDFSFTTCRVLIAYATKQQIQFKVFSLTKIDVTPTASRIWVEQSILRRITKHIFGDTIECFNMNYYIWLPFINKLNNCYNFLSLQCYFEYTKLLGA